MTALILIFAAAMVAILAAAFYPECDCNDCQEDQCNR